MLKYTLKYFNNELNCLTINTDDDLDYLRKEYSRIVDLPENESFEEFGDHLAYMLLIDNNLDLVLAEHYFIS